MNQGGWYCPDCGTLHDRLPAGAVNCKKCGGLGLCGYNRKPKLVPCLAAGCSETIWDDGGVNGPFLSQHIHHPTGSHPRGVAS